MQVVFYTFSKRVNSTARPGAGGASYSCIIKSPSSVIAPQISLVWQGSGNPSAYNYAYIADYGRYYWVRNWTYADRQWTADLQVDVLASWKTEIGASAKYILRAASDYDPEAIDTLYPATAEYAAEGTLSGTPLGWDVYGSGGGTFVVTVIGENNATAANSAVAMYMLSGTSVQTLINNQLNALDGAANNATASDVKEAVLQLLRLPFRFFSDLSQYIRNIMWFPFEFAAGAGGPIKLGLYQCLTAASNVSSPIRIFTSSIDISGFPAAGSDPWEYMAPFGTYYLEFQPFGIIPIDSADVVLGEAITMTVRVDAASGLGLLMVYVNRGLQGVRCIAARTAQIGVAVPYGGTAPDYAGAITGTASVIAAAAAYASGDASGGALAGAIGSAVSASSPNGYGAGTSGGGAALTGAPFLHYKVFGHVATDNAENGRPLAEHRTINTLSGFIQCRDGDISAPATAQELSEINSYLTGGFFYE